MSQPQLFPAARDEEAVRIALAPAPAKRPEKEPPSLEFAGMSSTRQEAPGIVCFTLTPRRN